MAETKPSASLSSGLLARKGGAKPAMRRPSVSHSEGGIEAGQDDLGWNDMGYDVNPDPNAPADQAAANQPNPLAAAVPDATPEVKRQQEQIAARLQAQPETDYPKETIGVPENPSTLSIGGMWMPEADDEDESVEQEEILASDSEETAEAPQELADEQPAETAEVPSSREFEQLRSEISDMAQMAAVPADDQPKKKRAAPGSKAKSAFTLRLDKERHLKLRLACAVNNKSAQKMVTEALDKMLNEMPEIKALAANVSE